MTKQERFTRLFEPCKIPLKRFAYSISYGSQQAEEIIADTMFYAYQNIDKLSSDKAFLSYLFTIARRVKSKIIKANSENNHNFDLDEFVSKELTPDERCDTILLYEAITKLKEEQKEALILNEFSGLTAKEISRIQNTTVYNVKIRIFRAKKLLKKLLSDSEIQNEKVG